VRWIRSAWDARVRVVDSTSCQSYCIILSVLRATDSRLRNPVDTESALQLTPSESEGCIGFFGTFASPSVESAFRQRRFSDELWLSCFMVPAAMLRVSLFLLADYQHLGMGPAFWLLLACRLLFLVVSALVFFALRRSASAAAANRLFFGWCFLLAALTVFALSTRPASNTELLGMSFALVLVAYCATPLPLHRQAILALTYSAAVLCISRRADSGTLSTVAVAYAMSNLFGAVTSWRLNHRRREAFLGNLRESELRTTLEEAVAEIRTLRGLVCICAWCKRIRDEREAWHAVETFVQSRTHAKFTHGICPDCFQSQAGEITR
jgi:hypothetical protein